MRDVYYRDDTVVLAWGLGILTLVIILTSMFYFITRDTREVTTIETAPIEQIQPEPTIIERPVLHEVPVVVPVEKPVIIEKLVPASSGQTPPPADTDIENDTLPPVGAGAR